MGGANGGGWLNSNAGQALSGELVKPKDMLGFLGRNPWVAPVAAGAATMMTAGAASPLLATTLAGEGAAAAGGAAAGGAAAGLGAGAGAGLGAGLGAAAPLGMATADAGAAASFAPEMGSLGASMLQAAPTASAAPLGMASQGAGAAGAFGPAVAGTPYNAASSSGLLGGMHMPNTNQMGRMGMNMMQQNMQPPQAPPVQRPPSMQQQQQPNPMPAFAMNQPLSINSGSNQSIQDILMRLRMMGGMQ